MTSPIKSSYTNDEAITFAHSMLEEMNGKVVSTHDLIDRTVLTKLSVSDCEREYKKFGHVKFLNYLKNVVEGQRIRKAALQASMGLGQTLHSLSQEKIDYMGLSMKVAITQLGVGECDEKTILCYLKATLLNMQALIVTSVSEEDENYAHKFLLLNANDKFAKIARKKKEAMLISEFFHLFKESIVFDPFLKLVFKAEDYEKSGTLLKAYFSAFKITFITDLVNNLTSTVKTNIPCDKVFKVAAMIVKMVPELLSSTPLNQIEKDLLDFVKKKEKENCVAAVQEMERIFPHTNWKSNIKEGEKIFVEGSQTEIDSIEKYLKLHNIPISISPIRNTEHYCALLKNPSVADLKRIPMHLRSCIQSFVTHHKVALIVTSYLDIEDS